MEETRSFRCPFHRLVRQAPAKPLKEHEKRRNQGSFILKKTTSRKVKRPNGSNQQATHTHETGVCFASF
jgi:hypothetical protein